MINQVLARRFWPNEDPIGKRIRFSSDWLTIVGVCGEVKHARLDEATDPEIYAPYVQVPASMLDMGGRDQNYVIRMAGASGNIADDVRKVIHSEDAEIVVTLNDMQALIYDTTAQPRFRTGLIAIFSSLALVLAAIGIYAVLTYSVTQRFKELGIRIALGAQPWQIRRLVLGQAFRLAGLGIGSGLLAAFFISHFLHSLLFGIAVHDWLTFTTVPMFMLAVVLLAGYGPARRAASVSPMTSLRQE
jgi:putative ABC transport system permease protein